MEKIKEILNKIIKHKSFQSFIIVALIAVIQLSNNVILGRNLSKDDFGLYSFIFLNIIKVISILVLFGQNSSIIRYFSAKNIHEYQWKRYIFNIQILIIIPIFIVVLIIKNIYDLNWFWFWMIAIGGYLMSVTSLIASFFRAAEKFLFAIFLQRSSPVLFIIFLSIIYILFKEISLPAVAISKLISFSIISVFLLYILIKWKSGDKKVNSEIYFGGFAFWELNLTVLAITNIDAFFIVKMLNYSELALFSVITAIMQIYEFTTTSLLNVYPQKFSKSKDINVFSFIKIILIIILFLGVFYLISTKFLLQFLFHGKYTVSFVLVLLFCIYGSLNILYVFPASYFIGHSSKKDLKLMLLVNIFSVIIKIALIFLLKDYGLNGFLISGITAMGFRTGLGYYLALR